MRLIEEIKQLFEQIQKDSWSNGTKALCVTLEKLVLERVKQATTHNNFMDFVHSKYRLRDVECMDFTFDEMMELVNEWLDTVLVGEQTEQKETTKP